MHSLQDKSYILSQDHSLHFPGFFPTQYVASTIIAQARGRAVKPYTGSPKTLRLFVNRALLWPHAFPPLRGDEIVRNNRSRARLAWVVEDHGGFFRVQDCELQRV